MEKSIAKIREEQNIKIDTLLDMDEDEVHFYYNHQTQQFLKRYYSDILNKDLKIINLEN